MVFGTKIVGDLYPEGVLCNPFGVEVARQYLCRTQAGQIPSPERSHEPPSRFLPGTQSTSCRPPSLATRASTKSRSDSRFR